MAKTQDHGAKSSGGVVTAGPWSARDSYVAETAVTIDRLTAKLERLERREDALKQQVAELQEHAQQSTRFQSLAESLRNSRDYKLDETVRLVKELRARVDSLEGPRAEYGALTHKSFAEVNRKLAELSEGQVREASRVGRLQPVSLAIGFLAAVIAASFIGLIA